LALPFFLAAPRRFAYQLWQAILAKTQYPQSRPSVVAKVEGRAAAASGTGLEVFSECACGACRVVSTYGGPRYTTVCHCSVCRGNNAAHGGDAVPFAAVKRASCRLEVEDSALTWDLAPLPPTCLPVLGAPAAVGAFVWTETSALGRRAHCSACGSPLAMDYGYFEPHTLWLAYPKVRILRRTVQETLPLRRYLARTQGGDGRVDADFCWGSRRVPVPAIEATVEQPDVAFGGSFVDTAAKQVPRPPKDAPKSLHGGVPAAVDTAGAAAATQGHGLDDYPPPQGVEQFEDVDWSGFYVDSGRL
jgi:hypothetical protein